jgi:hypothetical protein
MVGHEQVESPVPPDDPANEASSLHRFAELRSQRPVAVGGARDLEANVTERLDDRSAQPSRGPCDESDRCIRHLITVPPFGE